MDNVLTDKRIWVVIPVYNGMEYLEDAVNSVQLQPFPAIEIVIIDDGSTDGTSGLCDVLACGNARIHVIHKENGGVSSARNAGIDYVLSHSAAEGSYIAFLDADDSWEKGFFSERIEKLLNQKHQLIGFQSCDCDKNMKKTAEPGILDEGFHPGGDGHVWLHAKAHFGAMFYSAQLLSDYEIRFQDGLRYSEDKIFSMQCLYLAETVCLENRLLYLYRHISGSAMSSRKYGKQHFLPIIEAYLQLDHCMRGYANESRGNLTAARQCVSHYLMDMIDEHFQQWNRKPEIDVLLNEHPQYCAALMGEGDFDNIQPNPRYLSYVTHPYRYILQQYVLGIVFYIKRLIKRVIS